MRKYPLKPSAVTGSRLAARQPCPGAGEGVRELPAAPGPAPVLGALEGGPSARPALPGAARPLLTADGEKLEKRQKRTTKMTQGLERMPRRRAQNSSILQPPKWLQDATTAAGETPRVGTAGLK